MRRRLARLSALLLVLILIPALPGMAAAPTSRTLPEVADAPMLFDRPIPASPAVDVNWFSDAVFLGGARAQGLKDSGLLNGGLWLTPEGLNVRSARTEAVFSVDREKRTLSQALEGTGYKKVYLSLGLNEAPWMDEASFYTEFSGLIDDLRALLPECGIYVETIIPVTVARAAARTPDNTLLANRSELLRRLAREKKVYLVDTAAPLTAASGALAKEYALEDGLLLSAEGNAVLAQCLRTHTARD